MFEPLADGEGGRKSKLGPPPPPPTPSPPGPTAYKPRTNQGKVLFSDSHQRFAGAKAAGCHQLLPPSLGSPHTTSSWLQ